MPTTIARGFLLAVAVLVFVSQASFASSVIQGKVKDAQTGEALPSANITIIGTGMGAAADLNGKYFIRNVTAGSYTLRASYIGYKSVEVHVDVKEGVTVTHDFALENVGIKGEGIVVTAQASGQDQAINHQLVAPQIISVVSAARIQELPDANAAESVGRLPGVSILRSGGEGTQVVVRGLQPKYNAILVDGVRLASSGSSDRSADLSMISPNMLENIEVTKTVSPDQDADVLGGTVNFKMREAKGEKEGLGFNLLGQAGYSGLSDAYNKSNNYKYVASVEGRFFESLFGVFAQADLERRNLTSNEFGASYNHQGSSTTQYITTFLNLNDIPRDRQRANATIVLDYKLPDGKIALMNFGSSGKTTIQNRGEAYDIQNNVHNYNLAFDQSTVSVLTNALSVEQQLPVFHVEARLSHTYSETKTPADWTVGFQQASAGLSSFLDAANLSPQQIPKAANNDTNSTYLSTLVTNGSFSKERALTASLDLKANVNFTDAITSVIKFGGKYRHQTRTYSYDQFSGQGLGLTSARYVDNLIATHFPSTAKYANSTSIPVMPFMDPGFSYGKFLNGEYAMGIPLNFGMISEMATYIRNSADLIAQNNAIAYFHNNVASTTNNYTGSENQSAFYAMATVNVGPDLTLIPGVRYQDLSTTYTASRGVQNTSSAVGGPYLHYDTTTVVDHAYWLPDVILRYKPLPWCDLRLSYTNTLAYPDYNAIIPRIDVSVGSAIAWNNFRLVPSRSTNYDAYLSFYDNSIGLLTVGGFLKQIDNLIYSWSFYVSGASALPYYPPSLVSGATPQGVYNVTTFVNNPYQVKDYGLEVDWQTHFWYLPRPFDGLVLNVNYTHVFSKAQYPYTDARKEGRLLTYVDTSFTDRLLYQPSNIWNLSVGYDYEGFSIRVSMLYQADVFTGPNYWPQLRTATSAHSRWDVSLKQSLPWFGLQLYGDLNNINSANDISVIQGSGFPQSEQSYGMTADIGLRWQL
ncbi:MAG TPA: TonB-dependent receptor [Bacteroidota bacterium]|nr:TonB-dependent receptor [Bacteroidota bacterium]